MIILLMGQAAFILEIINDKLQVSINIINVSASIHSTLSKTSSSASRVLPYVHGRVFQPNWKMCGLAVPREPSLSLKSSRDATDCSLQANA